MRKLIIVVNGRGGCGKDTLCEIAAKHYCIKNISSITPIKRLAESAGWDGQKDPKSRKMLADLKQLFTEYNDLCNRYVLSEADQFMQSDKEEILFVHIREAAEIRKFTDAAKQKCNTVSLLVTRHTADYENTALGNEADDRVLDYPYTYRYDNTAPSLAALEADFIPFLERILAEETAR